MLNHKAEHYSLRGPSNTPARSSPVIAQAGASEASGRLAAATAKAVFTVQNSIAAGQSFYADVKAGLKGPAAHAIT